VYGAAFTSPEEPDGGVLDGFAAEKDGFAQIMVLHGDLGAVNSRYRPLSREKVASAGIDYLALGHVHQYSGLQRCGNTVCAYPGCMEGRGFDECGDKGFLLGTVVPGRVELRFVPFAARRYQILRVDVSELPALTAVEHALPGDTNNDVYRIILTGETEEELSESELTAALADRFYALEVRDHTRIKQDIWSGAGEDSLRGLFLKKLRAQYEAASPEERPQVERAVRFGLAAMDHRDM